MAIVKPTATSVGKRVLTMWANQQCTLRVLQNARDRVPPLITQAEYETAITVNPPVDPDDPDSLSQPSDPGA